MKVRIIKAEHYNWYKNRIGEEFNAILLKSGDTYKVEHEQDGRTDFGVSKEHCEIIEPVYDTTAIVESPDHRLFTAAVAAMQGMCANPQNTGSHKLYAEQAVLQAQALLTEIDKK